MSGGGSFGVLGRYPEIRMHSISQSHDEFDQSG